jgi:hypothetical protein
MIRTGADANRVLDRDDLNRGGAIDLGAVAKLSLIVTSPAANGAVNDHRAGIPIPRSQLHDIRKAHHFLRQVSGGVRSVPQLSVVLSPQQGAVPSDIRAQVKLRPAAR